MNAGIATGNELVKIKIALPDCFIEISLENCFKVI
jgi:hypothetical protein